MKRSFERIFFVNSLVIALCVIAQCSTTTAQINIVVPPGFGVAEGGGSTVNFPEGFRFQELEASEWFDELPNGPSLLTTITFRPDAGITAPFDVLLGHLELRVSTTDTQLGAMSLTYADNHGSDVTVVYDGPLTLTTQNILAEDGVTKEFDIAVPLTTPFAYDPGAGNLLIDFLITPIDGMVVPDGNTDFVFGNFGVVTGLPELVGHVNHSGPPQDMAVTMLPNGNVLQLTFVPEPASGLLAIGAAIVVLAGRRRRSQPLFVLAVFFCSVQCGAEIANAAPFFIDDFADGKLEDDSPVTWQQGGAPDPGTRDVSSGDLVQTPDVPGNSMSTFALLNDEPLIYGDVSLTTQLLVHVPNGNWASLFSRSLGNPNATLFGAIRPAGRNAEVTFAASVDGDTQFFATKNINLDVHNQDALLRFDVQGDQMKLWAWAPGTSQPVKPLITASVPAGYPVEAGTIGVLNIHQTTYRFIEVAQIPEPRTVVLIGAALTLPALLRRNEWKRD